jgi:hypothetical protein
MAGSLAVTTVIASYQKRLFTTPSDQIINRPSARFPAMESAAADETNKPTISNARRTSM